VDRVVVLKKTNKKRFYESETIIKEIKLKILCIFVPYKHKLKRKDKEKLGKMILNYEKVFTDEPEFNQFQTGITDNSTLECFLRESIGYLTKDDCSEKIAVKSRNVSPLLIRTIVCLSERYRTVDLYMTDSASAYNIARDLCSSVGLPVCVKNEDEIKNCKTGYIVRINDAISIFDVSKSIVYEDVRTELLYPLNMYPELPLLKILKDGVAAGKYKDIFKKGMVKIIGVISK